MEQIISERSGIASYPQTEPKKPNEELAIQQTVSLEEEETLDLYDHFDLLSFKVNIQASEWDKTKIINLIKPKFMSMQCSNAGCDARAIEVNEYEKKLMCDEHSEMLSDRDGYEPIHEVWAYKEREFDELETALVKQQVGYRFEFGYQ